MKALSCALFALLLFSGCAKHDANSPADTPVQEFKANGDLAGSHILIAYSGAMGADSTVTRTKEEAREKAMQLIGRLTEDVSQFETLAREESDGPSSEAGGNLGVWNKGSMVPAFEEAVEKLEVGAITTEPVETPFGYHIIRRNTMKMPFYGGDGFFISYVGAARAPEGITRTKEEAAALAEEVKTKLDADSFDELAKQYNDLGEGAIFLGAFHDDGQAPSELVDAYKTLSFGEVSGPLELPFGYAFVRRTSLEQRAGAHILISYQGAMRANPKVNRSREQAQAHAKELIETLLKNPDEFSEIAKKESDGPTGARGGDLGVWFKGQMIPAFDLAMDSLEVNAIDPQPVETPFGFHIIQRRAVPE